MTATLTALTGWPEWVIAAACRERDPDLFVIDGRMSMASGPGMRDALSVCDECPVLDDCSQWVDTWRQPPKSMIVAGRIYDGDGIRIGTCRHCKRQIIGRARDAWYCSNICQARAKAARSQP